MNWANLKKRIRRFLRDPDGNIWDDTALLRIYNDEQSDICMKTGVLERIQALRVPPMYGSSYTYDWEWPYREGSGRAHRCWRYHQQSDLVFVFLWESQQLGYSAGSEADYGDQWTHPWEAWMASKFGGPVPIWFPDDFRKSRYVAWDRDPIEGCSLRDIQSADPSWQVRQGTPQNYFRIDDLSN